MAYIESSVGEDSLIHLYFLAKEQRSVLGRSPNDVI